MWQKIEWTQQDCTEVETDLSLTSIKFWPCELRTTRQDTILWAATHEDTNSSLWFSQDTTNKTSIWLKLQVTGKQEEEGRKGKKRNDHWALALLEEALALPSHLSSVKCVGKTYHISGPVKGQFSFATVTIWTTCKKWAWLTLALTLYLPFFG